MKSSIYEHFMLMKSVALSDGLGFKPITMLRDTGSAQTLMLITVLLLSNESHTGANVLL